MKYNQPLVLVLTFVVIAICIAYLSRANAEGEKGPDGPEGIDGLEGPQYEPNIIVTSIVPYEIFHDTSANLLQAEHLSPGSSIYIPISNIGNVIHLEVIGETWPSDAEGAYLVDFIVGGTNVMSVAIPDYGTSTTYQLSCNITITSRLSASVFYEYTVYAYEPPQGVITGFNDSVVFDTTQANTMGLTLSVVSNMSSVEVHKVLITQTR